MFRFEIILFGLCLINKITSNAEVVTGNECLSTSVSNNDEKYENKINSIMVYTNELIKEFQDFILEEERKKENQKKLKKNIDYVEMRLNASLRMLEAAAQEYKNNSQALNLITRRKEALKLEMFSYEHRPFVALGDNMLFPMKLSIILTNINQVKMLLGQISASTDSKNIRNRIEKEVKYLESLNFKRRVAALESEDGVDIKKILTAMQFHKFNDHFSRRYNLTDKEFRVLDKMSWFTSDYKKLLQIQLGQVHPPEKNISTNSTLKLTLRDKLSNFVSVHVLEKLLEEQVEDISAYVIINEKLKKLKIHTFNSEDSLVNSTVFEGLKVYLNNEENTELGRMIIQKLTEEDEKLIDETKILQNPYRTTVELEIKEHLKKFSTRSVDVARGLETNEALINITKYEGRFVEYPNKILDARKKEFEILQKDVEEWKQKLFGEYENLLRKKDNETINKMRYLTKMNVISNIRNASWQLINSEKYKLSEENSKQNEIPSELLTFLLDTRYKIDPFLFMRRLEIIESTPIWMIGHTRKEGEDESVRKLLEMWQSFDYTISSLEEKEKFDEKFAKAIFVDKEKIINALKLNLENKDKDQHTVKDFTMRENMISKKMKQIGEEYEQLLKNKANKGYSYDDVFFAMDDYRV